MGTVAYFYTYTGIENPEEIEEINPKDYKWLGNVTHDGYPPYYKTLWKDSQNEFQFIFDIYNMYTVTNTPIECVFNNEEVETRTTNNLCITDTMFVMVDYIYVWFGKELGVYVSRFGSKFKKYNPELKNEDFSGKLKVKEW